MCIQVLAEVARELHSRRAGCWTHATPEARKRLLALAIAVLAPAVLPPSVSAQQTATGSVRLVVRADQLPTGGVEADSQTILWMAPESMEETERLAALWAAGDDAVALRAWRSVVETEVKANRLATDEQADAAANWIAARAVSIASRKLGDGPDQLVDERAREIRTATRSTAVASIERSALRGK